MTTKNKNKGQIANPDELITALYCRLSVEDMKDHDKKKGEIDESNSITNQKQILLDYAKKHSYKNTMFFVDDGISGTRFDREAFQRMQRMAENGEISRIIVKDLSRFGREQVEAGRLTQIVYPSLGITFISIQENVNSTTGEGMEMLPFYNIFNEWYAAQTSKKIRAVWQSKAEHGERVSPSVPYGYKKSEDNPKQWVIDEPAAQIVKKIYALCLAGRGPSQIARQLEEEQVLIPSAYYETIGRTHSQKVFRNPYAWDQVTVVHILENRQYTGCAVNFKTTTVSYKVHKTIYKPKEEHQIIPNMQEAIIPEEEWLRVQTLRANKRRPNRTGEVSMFSGLLYCGDCGAKLYYCTCNTYKDDSQDHFVCSNYKSNTGSCQIHYIREVTLYKRVLECIQRTLTYVRLFRDDFTQEMLTQDEASRKAELTQKRKALFGAQKRMEELDKIIQRLYEDSVLGKLSDARYMKLSAQYETEQAEIGRLAKALEQEIESEAEQVADVGRFLQLADRYSDLQELDAATVNELIEKIVIYGPEKIGGKKHVTIEVYFTYVGKIRIPLSKPEPLAATEKPVWRKSRRFYRKLNLLPYEPPPKDRPLFL